MFCKKVKACNANLRFKGKYHNITYLLFYWFGFNQASESVDNFSVTKLLNPN